MADSSKIEWFLGPQRLQRSLFISGCGAALAVTALAFAPVLPHAGLWQILAPGHQRSAPTSSAWAGNLENPVTPAPAASGAAHPLTSASYTTGFSEASEAPLPHRAAFASRTSADCPDDLNCTFRTRAAQHAASAPPRPVASAASSNSAAVAAGPRPKHKPASLTAFLPHLPTTRTLMKPFAFVADAVGGLMHRL